MPAMQLQKILGDAKFLTHGKKLPIKFTAPSGGTASQQYSDAWKPEDKIAIPQLTPPWFLPAEGGNKYYQQTCDKIGKNFKDFHDAMVDAIGFAHNMWKLQAKFQNLTIVTAPIAMGTPGCLSGPELESLIKTAPMVASFTGNKAKHRDAVAKGVSKCFKDWQDGVAVPGLPMFPALIMVTMPMAPPMPSVPVPLIACVSTQLSAMIMPDSMKSAMDDALDGELKSKDEDKHYEALHDAIATVVSVGFVAWLGSQQVMNILGKGPVPMFAPPYVPGGPVMGGDIVSMPGHLAA